MWPGVGDTVSRALLLLTSLSDGQDATQPPPTSPTSPALPPHVDQSWCWPGVPGARGCGGAHLQVPSANLRPRLLYYPRRQHHQNMSSLARLVTQTFESASLIIKESYEDMEVVRFQVARLQVLLLLSSCLQTPSFARRSLVCVTLETVVTPVRPGCSSSSPGDRGRHLVQQLS